MSAKPTAATAARRNSIGSVKCSAKYLSRNATPKKSTTTPMRVIALPPVNQAQSGLTLGATGDAIRARRDGLERAFGRFDRRQRVDGRLADIAEASWARRASSRRRIRRRSPRLPFEHGDAPLELGDPLQQHALKGSQCGIARRRGPSRQTPRRRRASRRPPLDGARILLSFAPMMNPAIPPSAAPQSRHKRWPTSAPTKSPISAAIAAALSVVMRLDGSPERRFAPLPPGGERLGAALRRLYDPPDASLRAASPRGGERLGAALRRSSAIAAQREHVRLETVERHAIRRHRRRDEERDARKDAAPPAHRLAAVTRG